MSFDKDIIYQHREKCILSLTKIYIYKWNACVTLNMYKKKKKYIVHINIITRSIL